MAALKYLWLKSFFTYLKQPQIKGTRHTDHHSCSELLKSNITDSSSWKESQ